MERWWSPRDDRIILTVRVTPSARRSEIVDHSGARLRIKVAAPAVEGKANDEVIRFLAELLGVRRSAVTVIRGQHARDKVVEVVGIVEPPEPLRS